MQKLFVAAFGFVFGAVGIGMSGYSVYQGYSWYQASQWSQVPGKIQSLELKVSHDDSTTYGVECVYAYTTGGKTYSGNRPSFYSGTDNLGSFQRDLHHRLKKAQKAGQVSVWVSPSDPSQSVLDRTFRPGFFAFSQLFSIAFGSIGLSVLAFAFSKRSPVVKHGMLRVQSNRASTRACCTMMMMFHGVMALYGFLVAAICLMNGDLAALMVVLFSSLFAIGFVIAAKTRSKNRHTGYLVLPTDESPPNSDAFLSLPASWSGPVEMDLRWKIPRPPTNQIGLEDHEADSASIELPSVQGSMNETKIEIPLPDMSEIQTSSMPVVLDVTGLIGGYPYSDGFEVPVDFVSRLKQK